MEKEATSFWADIKKYEDILSKDPRSYCFAPLSELYRKLGLLDDAINVAKRGTEAHPEYIGGYMALGRAHYEKKNRTEARECLEKVTKATPENLLAQKLLSQIYQEEGNLSAAEQALEVLVSFNTEDVESRLVLESLRRSRNQQEQLAGAVAGDEQFAFHETSPVPSAFGQEPCADEENYSQVNESEDLFPEPDEDFEEILLGELDEDLVEVNSSQTVEPAPLPTVTLAELYESQGILDRALEVYSDLLKQEPGNLALLERSKSLRNRIEKDEPNAESFCTNAIEQFVGAETIVEPGYVEELSDITVETQPESAFEREATILHTLEKLLDSIRRRKECQSKVL